MEYSIQEVAKAAKTTSRTLRHYANVGLLAPSRIGQNGYRYYSDESLLRLQRILLLRQLGLSLEAIREVLTTQDLGPSKETEILQNHLEYLQGEKDRIGAQIASVKRTIATLNQPADKESKNLMSKNIFEGFDHTQHKEEVEERWGKAAYAKSDNWWRGLGKNGQADWKTALQELNSDWIKAAERGEDPASPVAQALAARHIEWLKSVPGTPAHEKGGDLKGYVLGLAQMYVADPRFAANYGGEAGATFVRDALIHHAETSDYYS